MSPNCADAREVFCDMHSGGWTLIGQLGGVNDNIYDRWMVSNVKLDCYDVLRLKTGHSAVSMQSTWPSIMRTR